MSERISNEVQTALVAQFNAAHLAFMGHAEAAAKAAVAAVHHNRIKGLTLMELIGHENVTENDLRAWLHEHPKRLVDEEPAWLMAAVRTAKKMRQDQTALGSIPNETLQLTFQCAGIIPPDPKREGQQERHEPTPVALFTQCLADIRIRSEKAFKNAGGWGDSEKKYIRAHLEKLRAFLNELESKL